MLVPALKALGYLHKEGYAHSRLSASNVLAAGDQLKLSCDSAIRAGEGGSIAEDMRALGVLIVQALTQQSPSAGANRGDPGAVCGYRAALSRSGSREKMDCGTSAGAARRACRRGRFHRNAACRLRVCRDRKRQRPEAYASNIGVPKWIYAGLAALVLIVVLAAVMRRQDAAPVATAPVDGDPADSDTEQPPAR